MGTLRSVVSVLLFSCIAFAQNSDEPLKSPDQPKPQGPSQPAETSDAAVQAAAVQKYCALISQGVEHSDVLDKFCEWTLSLKGKLPNIVSEQKTTRLMQVYGDHFHAVDTITAKVAYENGAVRYSDLTLNNRPFRGTMDEIHGSWSTGEYGIDLQSLFMVKQPAVFKFLKIEKEHFKGAYIFEETITSDANHSWLLTFGLGEKRKQTIPGYVAKIWLMGDSQVVHIERETTKIAKDFPIRWSMKATDYADTPLGDGSHMVLPTKNIMVLCDLAKWDGCSMNHLEFSNWHKFASAHRILTDDPAPEPK